MLVPLFTVSEIGCVWVVWPALDARIVIEASPVAVDPLVPIVSVVVTDPLAGGVTVDPGLKPALAVPDGRFSTSTSTPLLNPFWLLTVTA
jgi:hypothetical protein